jgi:CRP-like cAMP-binding protein
MIARVPGHRWADKSEQRATTPIALKNQILQQLPARDRETLLMESDYLELPFGDTYARAGDRISGVYFPETGVISLVSEMSTGHQVAIGAVGAEGMTGLGTVLGISHYRQSLIALLESGGHHISAARFRNTFQQSEALRRVTLAHIGLRMRELRTAAACNRVHSHRQRLARWLLVITDKAKQQSLPVTHEALAQLVGGPRHAVTAALNELRAKGAIARISRRVDILERSVLVAHACECYATGKSRS